MSGLKRWLETTTCNDWFPEEHPQLAWPACRGWAVCKTKGASTYFGVIMNKYCTAAGNPRLIIELCPYGMQYIAAPPDLLIISAEPDRQLNRLRAMFAAADFSHYALRHSLAEYNLLEAVREGDDARS